MQFVDSRCALFIQMMEFLEAPMYWKFIMASGWSGDTNGPAAQLEVPRNYWFMPPNAEQMRLAIDEVGEGVIFFLRGEARPNGTMKMSLCEVVLERATAAGEIVDERPEPGSCGLAPEVFPALACRLDLLYFQFLASSQPGDRASGTDRSSELVGIRESVDRVRAEMSQTWTQLAALLETGGAGVPRVELEGGAGSDVPLVELGGTSGSEVPLVEERDVDGTRDSVSTGFVWPTVAGGTVGVRRKRSVSGGNVGWVVPSKVPRTSVGGASPDGLTVASDVSDSTWTVDSTEVGSIVGV